jgi:hypothetical protein
MKPTIGQTIVAAAAAVVVASIVVGMILVGSPAEGRLQQLDSARIEDLKGIMVGIDSFWSRNERLPASLEELIADPRVGVKTQDPGSAAQYDFAPVDEDTFELCATFDLESPAPARPSSADFWRHGAARQCFELDVDTSGPGADRS